MISILKHVVDFSGGFGCGSNEIFFLKTSNYLEIPKLSTLKVLEVSPDLKPTHFFTQQEPHKERTTEEEEEGRAFGLSKLINSEGQMILYSKQRLNSGSGAHLWTRFA